jgi:hypothetical protein
MDERLRFVVEAERGEEFFRALCARYGVQAKTGYKWLGRFVAEGVAGLAEQSRRPHHSPTATSPASVALVELRGRRAIARGSNGRLTGSAPSINTKRPHEALGGRPPATLYTGSPPRIPLNSPRSNIPDISW